MLPILFPYIVSLWLIQMSCGMLWCIYVWISPKGEGVASLFSPCHSQGSSLGCSKDSNYSDSLSHFTGPWVCGFCRESGHLIQVLRHLRKEFNSCYMSPVLLTEKTKPGKLFPFWFLIQPTRHQAGYTENPGASCWGEKHSHFQVTHFT